MDQLTPARPPPRPIKRLLIANRGEIATRILLTATELSLQAYTLHTPHDTSHTSSPPFSTTHTVPLPSPSSFTDISFLISIIKEYEIDAVHPGYGFLSENAEFARRVWDEAGAVVIGPGWKILGRVGDKLGARDVAISNDVPVLPALSTPTSSPAPILAFARTVGFPIIVKALDGGGGRGIRLVRGEGELEAQVRRAVEESPSKRVFAEKAAVAEGGGKEGKGGREGGGFRHVEVQIVGDGRGGVAHLWERECSLQRRWGKVVEVAPSTIADRELMARIIQDAVKMAKSLSYFSLGTFEFLVSPHTQPPSYFFLEINPRLQVEHTITESITHTDLVRIQLLLQQGYPLSACGIPAAYLDADPRLPPPAHAIQLRVTAEDAARDFSVSIGRIKEVRWPMGNGVRVDSHIAAGRAATVVGAEYDSLLAKIVVSAASWEAVVVKARRALGDTGVVGVGTNLDVLRGVVGHVDFEQGRCDTRWLEEKLHEVLSLGREIAGQDGLVVRERGDGDGDDEVGNGGTGMAPLFRKGDAWSISLAAAGDGVDGDSSPSHSGVKGGRVASMRHLEIARVLRNDFPASLSAEILFTAPSTSASSSEAVTTPYTLTLQSTKASASAATSSHPRANASDPSHISIPFPGKLVEVLVDEGDVIKEGDVICVVQQMKMELEVRSPKSGRAVWVMEMEDGEEVGEGMLAAVVESGGDAKL